MQMALSLITKKRMYDMINEMLPKAVEIFTGCKIGDIIELQGKELKFLC